MSVPLARRQLVTRPGRTAAGVAGIAVALLLILALNAIVAGMERQITQFIDKSGPDVVVAQSGVDTIHMSESTLPRRTADAIAALPDVAAVRPISLVTTTVERGDKRGLAYVVGEERPGSTVPLASGRPARPGEIVLDRELARKLNAGPGAIVRVLGMDRRVSGEIEGTSTHVNSVAIVPRGDLAPVLGGANVVNYIFVNGTGGEPAAALADRINRAVPGVKASTRASFAGSERRLVNDMSTDLVHAMTFVGFLIGVCVAALVAYSLTLSQTRDYAVLRALGMRARAALGLVLAQVGATVAAGFALALGLVWAIASFMSMHDTAMRWVIDTGDVLKAFVVAGLVAAFAAAAPVLRVVRIDPASVFRR